MNEIKREFKTQFIAKTKMWRIEFQTINFVAKADLENTMEQFNQFVDAYLTHFATDSAALAEPFPWLQDRILSTLLEYWIPLSRIAEQYHIPGYEKRLDKLTEYNLAEFTQKAKELKMPFKGVLLYLNKRPISYFYPYTANSFVALPWMDDVPTKTGQGSQQEKLLALPHELGHHIYWNSDFSQIGKETAANQVTVFQGDILGTRLVFPPTILEPLQADLDEIERESLLKMLNRWTEEIFADVVAVYLLGEGASKFSDSAQNTALRLCRNEKDAVYDDGEHPSPYLRPFISGYVTQVVDSQGNWGNYSSRFNFKIPDLFPVMTDTKKQTTVLISTEKVLAAFTLAVQHIDGLVQKGLTPSAGRIDSFEKLLGFVKAKKQLETPHKIINEVLLTPFVIEHNLVFGICTNCLLPRMGICTSCGQ